MRQQQQVKLMEQRFQLAPSPPAAECNTCVASTTLPHINDCFQTPQLSCQHLPPCLPPGDHLYRMDYKEFVRKHRESGAAITIAALPCDEKRASAFGLMKIDESGRVIEFAEKPSGDALKAMQVDTTVLGVDKKT
jgi:hypothetical protein